MPFRWVKSRANVLRAAVGCSRTISYGLLTDGGVRDATKRVRVTRTPQALNLVVHKPCEHSHPRCTHVVLMGETCTWKKSLDYVTTTALHDLLRTRQRDPRLRTHHKGLHEILEQKHNDHRVLRVFYLPRGNVHEVGVCLYPIRELRASLEAEAGGGLSSTAAGDRVVAPPSSSGRWKPSSSSCRYAFAEAVPGSRRYPRPEPHDADGLCRANRRRRRSRDDLRDRAHHVFLLSVQVLRDGDDVVVDGSGLAATSEGKAAAAIGGGGGGGGVKRRRGR